MAETHCQHGTQRCSSTALLPNPSFPSALPRGPSTAVSAHPCVCQHHNVEPKRRGWSLGIPFWLPQYLLSCFPAAPLLAALLLRWMQCPSSLHHKSQAVGITFCCPCTCFAFSCNLPGCQSRTVAGSLLPGKLNTYILHKEIRGLALKMEYTSL